MHKRVGIYMLSAVIVCLFCAAVYICALPNSTQGGWVVSPITRLKLMYRSRTVDELVVPYHHNFDDAYPSGGYDRLLVCTNKATGKRYMHYYRGVFPCPLPPYDIIRINGNGMISGYEPGSCHE